MDDAGSAADPLPPRSSGRRRAASAAGRRCRSRVSWRPGGRFRASASSTSSRRRSHELHAAAGVGRALPMDRPPRLAFANLLPRLVFLFEGVRDAFDPGRTFG